MRDGTQHADGQDRRGLDRSLVIDEVLPVSQLRRDVLVDALDLWIGVALSHKDTPRERIAEAFATRQHLAAFRYTP